LGLKRSGIVRLGYVRIGLPDPRLARARAFYRNTLGLMETRVEPQRTYLRCWHESLHHSLVLDESDAGRLIEVGFQVADARDLEPLAAAVRQRGIDVAEDAPEAALRGIGASLSFEIPGGQHLRLFERMEQVGYATGFESPDWVVPRELRGTPAPLYLNHVGITVPDPGATVDFLTGALGFVVSEKIVSDDGGKLLSALLFRMSKDVGGQELAIYPGPAGRLHHVAFTKEDGADILIDGQYLRNDRVRIDAYGPTRQPYGKTFSLHFFDPFDVRLELCAGGRLTEAHPEFEPVVWTEAALPKALSWYDKHLNEAFLAPSL
jgi:catechol 2,3-dioxygenase